MDIQLNQKDMARLEFISRTIRALRREQKMSQNQLAKLSGLHPSTIKNMERRFPIYNPTIALLFRISQALEVDVGVFFSSLDP